MNTAGLVATQAAYAGGQDWFDALLAYLRGIDPKRYTVLVADFWNRPGDPPIAAFIIKGI